MSYVSDKINYVIHVLNKNRQFGLTEVCEYIHEIEQTGEDTYVVKVYIPLYKHSVKINITISTYFEEVIGNYKDKNINVVILPKCATKAQIKAHLVKYNQVYVL